MFAPALDFLDELQAHNDKAWFEAHRDRYERDVKAPAVELVVGFAPRLAALSSNFRAVATGTGSSISRIHRDTRFSADKSPYKDWIGIHFAHAAGREAPGLHLHLKRGDCGVGIGVWQLEPAQLEAIRERIADPDGGWGPVRSGLDRAGFSFIGEALVRVPKKYPADHPHAEDLRRKTFGAGRPIDPGLPMSAMLDALEGSYRAGWPLMAFLTHSLGLPS